MCCVARASARRSWRALGLCLALAAPPGLGCARAPVPAAQAPRATLRPAPQVEVGSELASCGGSGPDTLVVTLSRIPEEAELRRAICDWFSDEPWHVRLRSVGSALPRAERPSPGELRVTILRASELAAQLNVTAPGREPGDSPSRWLEHVSLSQGFDAVGIEVIAQTLHSTAQASLSRAFPAPPPAPARPAPAAPPAPAATPPAPVPAPAALSSQLAAASSMPAAPGSDGPRAESAHGSRAFPLPVHSALGYQFHARGGEPITHGPELRLELDWLVRSVVLASFVRGTWFTSTPATTNGLQIGLEGMGLGGGLAASLPLQHWLGRIAFGSNVELVNIQAIVADTETLRSAGSGGARPRVFLTGEAGVSARLGRIELGASGLLRWQTSESHYDALEDGRPHALVRAWRLQPGAALELAYVW
ncbi:MAG TPA: hypothetical protein VFS67_34635 [Polyangiaceae bacterium]|nr:hypothetical protein [Polyangiaceae bacterium]